MGRNGTLLVGPLVVAIAVSGCYTQFGVTREETYAELPEYEVYEVYEDSDAYAEEYTEEGYQEARERFYFHYYYPSFSVGFGVGGPWYGGWPYAYYDPYWWGPSYFTSYFWYPWCWYPSYYYYPVSYGYYGYPYVWHYPYYPVYSPGVADVHTRTRGFGNTRTAGGIRGFGDTPRDGHRDPGTVLAGGAYRSPREEPAVVDGASQQSGGRGGLNRQPVTRDRKAGLDREATAPGRVEATSIRTDGSGKPVRVKIRKSGTPSGPSPVDAKSGSSGGRRTYRPSGQSTDSPAPIRVKIRKSGTPSGSSRVATKSGSSGSRQTYKPSPSRSSRPPTSYGGSRGSVRSGPSGASQPRSAPRSAPPSSGGSRGRSRR